jgi:uncharacterized membrane protein
MMGGFGMGGFGGMGAGGILWIVLLGVIVWAVVKAATRTSTPSSTESARAILDGRLARGELSIDEYRRLRETVQ